MTQHDSTVQGAPCWVDLFTSDMAKAEGFYGGLFGWTAENPGPEYGGYINFHKNGQPVAGCMTND
ncbi:MAG: VOC family protein, partial [Mycobacteriaceae bacterium]